MTNNGMLLSPQQHQYLTEWVEAFLARRDIEIAELDGRITSKQRADIRHSARMDASRVVRALTEALTVRPTMISAPRAQEGGHAARYDRLADLIANVK